MKIAILSSPTAWHFLDLKRAAGSDHYLFNLPFEELHATVKTNQEETSDLIEVGNRELLDTDCVIVRTMPSGSLQQIIFRMDVLGRLAETGMRVLNSPRSIEIAVDKYLSLALLSAANIPVPRTQVSQSVSRALDHFEQLNSNVVVKPLFGSMGNGIIRIQDTSEAQSVFENKIELGEVVYQQEFINHEGFDIRVLVLGKTILAMKRVNRAHWITNISQGGTGHFHEVTAMEKRLAIDSAKAVGAFFAGVDIVYDRDSGNPVVVEVNAVPGWREISSVLKLDVAKLMIEEVEKSASVASIHSVSSSNSSHAPSS